MNQPQHTIHAELLELSPTLAAFPKTNVYKVPDGYFETLPALLLIQTGRQTDVNTDSSVPAGYFENLSDNIMNRIRQEAAAVDDHSALLSDIGKTNVFTVPAGYFDILPSQILANIAAENGGVSGETRAISPTVAAIGNANIFSVPPGYFENVSLQLQPGDAQPAKVVAMSGFRKIYRYAAAAVVLGFVAFSTVFILNKNKGSKLSVDLAVMTEARHIIKTGSFDEEMESLSDADIVNFLESKGQDVDAALVASLADDSKALPEAEDYLIDEHALDDVLKKLDLNN